MRSIVQGMLSSCSYGSCVPLKIAEKCYQATSYSSALHPNEYFVERDKACLEYPYNSNFEAKE